MWYKIGFFVRASGVPVIKSRMQMLPFFFSLPRITFAGAKDMHSALSAKSYDLRL